MLTKSPFPIYKEEKLTNPQRAQSWSPEGVLFDGSSVSALPVGMTRLPEKSSLLEKLVKGGVEVHSDGRMYGQVSVFHGCGNDPVGGDIRRVEIARWLAFFEQGQTTFKPHFVAYEGGAHIRCGGGAAVSHAWMVELAHGPEDHVMVAIRTMKPQNKAP
jgi:hypothetical protein